MHAHTDTLTEFKKHASFFCVCVCVFILVVVLQIAGQGFREECFPMFAKGSRSVVHVELPVVYIVHALTI